jgi:ribosomal protein L20
VLLEELEIARRQRATLESEKQFWVERESSFRA